MSRVYSGCDWVCAACTFENSLRKSSCEVGTGGPNIAESFLAKKFGDIGTFGDIEHFRRYPFITFWLECVATTPFNV